MPCDSKRTAEVKLSSANWERLLQVAEERKWKIERISDVQVALWLDISVKVVLTRGSDVAEVWRSRILPGQKTDAQYRAQLNAEYALGTVKAGAKATNSKITSEQTVKRTVMVGGKAEQRQVTKLTISMGAGANWRRS